MTKYSLGVDLGTTYTAAAVGRGPTATPLQLGSESTAEPSVVVFRDDGEMLVGDPAERRAATEPASCAREFKRRLGDSVPLIVAGGPHTVEELMGFQLSDVVRRATEQEGEAPAVIVLTHPANYTEFKLAKLREVAQLAGLDLSQVSLLPEPEAAAITYTQSQRVEVGEVIAVYDFGGGTFDAAVLRRSASGFELVGLPEGMERLGGIDFDQAVLAHVDAAVNGLVSTADRSDPRTLPAQARLRVDARRAKEALSTDADTTIAVALPGLNTEVRLTRAEFETMVRPRIAQTVSALERTVATAGLSMSDVSRILLVGGTSRMPIVAEIVGGTTGRPVSIDTHPKLAIANGAALAGAAMLAAPIDATPEGWQAPTKVVATTAEPVGDNRRRLALVFAAFGAVGLAIAAAVFSFGRSDDTASDPTTPGAPAATDPAQQPVVSEPAAAPPPRSEPLATEPPVSVTTPERPADGPVQVADLDAEVVAMGLALDGDVLALSADRQVVRVSSDGSMEIVLDSITDPGQVGGIAESPDGAILATTSDGVINLEDGTVVVDGAEVGLGSTPGPIAFDGVGSAYVTDDDNRRVIRRAPDGALSLVAGNGEDDPGAPPPDGATATDVAIGPVAGLGIDDSGRLVIVQRTSGSVLAVAQNGTISTLPTAAPAGLPAAATVDRNGGVWFSDGRALFQVASA